MSTSNSIRFTLRSPCQRRPRSITDGCTSQDALEMRPPDALFQPSRRHDATLACSILECMTLHALQCSMLECTTLHCMLCLDSTTLHYNALFWRARHCNTQHSTVCFIL